MILFIFMPSKTLCESKLVTFLCIFLFCLTIYLLFFMHFTRCKHIQICMCEYIWRLSLSSSSSLVDRGLYVWHFPNRIKTVQDIFSPLFTSLLLCGSQSVDLHDPHIFSLQTSKRGRKISLNIINLRTSVCLLSTTERFVKQSPFCN